MERLLVSVKKNGFTKRPDPDVVIQTAGNGIDGFEGATVMGRYQVGKVVFQCQNGKFFDCVDLESNKHRYIKITEDNLVLQKEIQIFEKLRSLRKANPKKSGTPFPQLVTSGQARFNNLDNFNSIFQPIVLQNSLVDLI